MRNWFDMAEFKCSAGSQCHMKLLGPINKPNVSNSFYSKISLIQYGVYNDNLYITIYTP